MVRRDGIMSREESTSSNGEGLDTEKISAKFQLMFATESVYVFLRMYCLLVSLLADTRDYVRLFPPGHDPADVRYVPTPMKEERNKVFQPVADFPGVIAMLEKVVCRMVEAKDFESYCRRVSKEKVHQMAILPKLIDKCTDALLNVTKENVLLHIFDYCLLREQVSTVCVGINPLSLYTLL